ncbi:DAO-domain-containing protein [Coniochaeta ligniaria NRRL 30616]|uniref:DAO-domain-containing protein n=1 Tax=Coniochaeta ligniaria NRRL 30616 TaxID=1408157 RepID=A0A1J7IMQ3_9PEZI|nr:DAO-domain-containing protein [Coniochaeta ligniaria NRRL 30616]
MVIREVAAGQSGLPTPNSTKSYWLNDPSKILYGHRTTQDLPETADIVIVGSGITGAFAAHFLKHGDAPNDTVVMLEAREACWGATGRNGGHCQPVVYASKPQIAAFELETYHFLKNFVEEHDIPCDWVSFSGVHTFLTQDLFDVASKAAALLQKTHPDLGSQFTIVREQEALASLRIPSAKGAIVQEHAASVWPYKLVAWILERLLKEFPASSFNLQTNTPVLKLEKADRDAGWALTTPRGRITAKKVLLCTNGYTSRLLPAFSDLIVPTRGQVSALLPPKGKDGMSVAKLQHSYVTLGDYPPPAPYRGEYLVQRPLPGGELIFGGGRRMVEGENVGVWRDDKIDVPIAKHLRSKLSPPLDLTPVEPRENSAGKEGGLLLDATFEWTGIMGYSRDSHAWVGAVPESLGGAGAEGGLYICAGYTGHGMPVAALAAREVVGIMAGGAAAAKARSRLPKEYELTESRVYVARNEFKTVAEAQKDGWAADFPDLFENMRRL